MSRLGIQDLAAILRGLQCVVNAALKIQEGQCKQIWYNSSVKAMAEDLRTNVNMSTGGYLSSPNAKADLMKQIAEIIERASMVVEGVKGYAKYSTGMEFTSEQLSRNNEINELSLHRRNQHKFSNEQLKGCVYKENIYISDDSNRSKDTVQGENSSHDNNFFAKPAAENISLLQAMNSEKTKREASVEGAINRQTLSDAARQRKVPSSRVARMLAFGGLAAGLSAGALAELTRRTLRLAGLEAATPASSSSVDSTFLTPANAERIVNTLCKVRGAALKIGQILSIQDNNIISPTLQKAFERVRQSADFMPSWQVERVLQIELGPDWRGKMQEFEPKPFAAASIGQVHLVTLLNGCEAAMKIQYPGVARGIQSDIDNLVGIMKVWNIFPEGFFIDNVVEVAKRELAWEVDYIREAECTKKFKELLKPYPDYIVPDVIDELSTREVFTTQLVEGIPVDQCADFSEATRHRICFLVMQLCLKELFEFRYMQTDPNWSNFFYNPDSGKLALLDFGASREYNKEFMDLYIEVIRGAADGDRTRVLEVSHDIGFLTGYESKVMQEAHVDAVMILGEVFRSQEPFDFGTQRTTEHMQRLVPTMLHHRLCAPPEQIYSLHRKLSGVFLLCSRLRVRMLCRPLFEEAYAKYTCRPLEL